MTILGKVIGGPSPASIDLKGTELILDADADTTITADTDDRIDIKIAGADDFKFTANNFNVLSGSTLTIDSGATITNSGTANNFGTDPESAYAGVLETNALFTDQVIFGPSVDGRSWNGLWNKASLFSSLMLATIEDSTELQLNIWDLTEQSSGTISTTPLATLDFSTAATPTSVAACMGYIIIGHEDGVTIVDPHSGAWAERATGWPRTLSTGTLPALVDNSVGSVAAGLSLQSSYDPRTQGPMPCFGIGFLSGADGAGIMKHDGNYFSTVGAPNGTYTVTGFVNGKMLFTNSDNRLEITDDVDIIQADDFSKNKVAISTTYPYGLALPTSVAAANSKIAYGAAGGLTVLDVSDGLTASDFATSNETNILSSIVTRAYNTGFWKGDIRGIWLANSKTVDRSYKANTLTENGTVTEGAVESGSELLGYSGFSTTNNFSRADDADWNSIANGSLCISGWYKMTADGDSQLAGLHNADDSRRFTLMQNGGEIMAICQGATTYVTVQEGSAEQYRDSKWHHFCWVRESNVFHELYMDGVSIGSSTTDTGSITASMLMYVGRDGANNSAGAISNMSISLIRLTATVPTAQEVRRIFDAERGMFVASAECLLQSGSTDAVLDVDVDPLTNKVLVTQTDAITIFDGFVVDSKPTVNSGNSEKGQLWGDLRTEQNSANAYVTALATDQRQVNEMVRGLASDLPAGVDLSKAKGWAHFRTYAPAAIDQSFNVKSVVRDGTGEFTVNWAVPFKNDNYPVFVMTAYNNLAWLANASTPYSSSKFVEVQTRNTSFSLDSPGPCMVVAFGELENE